MTRVPARRAPIRRIIQATLGVTLLTSVAVATYGAAVDRPPPRDSSLANFRLVDSAGCAYSIESFPPDSVLAIYFGYKTCLRACPVALDNIAAAMDGLGAQGASVRPIFVDVDPERAALVNLQLYTQSFGSDFLGLTGSAEAVEHAARSFKVQVERLQFSTDRADYAMTHVSPIFVMRPGNSHPLALEPTSSPDAIAAALETALRTEPLP
jgi:protein SCO1